MEEEGMVAHDQIRATPESLRHDPLRDVQRDKYSPDASIGVACLESHVIPLPCDIEGSPGFHDFLYAPHRHRVFTPEK
jgi:hypothetical protein